MTALPRVGLGTAQFGLDYGINNPSGMVTKAEVTSIVQAAADSGISFFDTARAYGKSEKVLGAVLSNLALKNKIILCTKLHLRETDCATKESALRRASQSLEQSLKFLDAACIDILMVHRPAHRTMYSGAIWDFLLAQKERGRIRHLGVSIANGPAEAFECSEDRSVEIIQIPFNVWDHRWNRVFKSAQQHDMPIVSRSTYLQGLLAMDSTHVGGKLPAALPYHRRWVELCASNDLDPVEVALRYALSEPAIASTIIGCDSLKQLKRNLEIISRGPLPKQTIDSISGAFSDVPEAILNPALW